MHNTYESIKTSTVEEILTVLESLGYTTDNSEASFSLKKELANIIDFHDESVDKFIYEKQFEELNYKQ